MDVLVDDGIAPTTFASGLEEPAQILSYDDTVPYEEQIQVEEPGSSLANRISKGKVYLLADAAGAGSSERAAGRRKAFDDPAEDDTEMMEDDTMDLDLDIRPNALLFSGPPIAHLPTQRIFAYATHFEAHPLGLEWVSDTTCVLIFSSRASAQKAYRLLQRTPHEGRSLEDAAVSAKSIPVPLWPAEKQLSRTLEMALGKASAAEKRESERKKQEAGLSAPLRMRWARIDDVKKKGASQESEFYKKHGSLAGKETVNGRDIPNLSGSRKRGRPDEFDEEGQRARLDRELDAFLEENSDGEGDGDSSLTGCLDQEPDESFREGDTPESPPSKMRSDYIAGDGRTRLQKSSNRRGHSDHGDGSGRRRGRGGGGRGQLQEGYPDGYVSLSLRERIGGARDHLASGRETKRRRGGDANRARDRDSAPAGESRRGRNARPHKTQQELDDELDAFLNGGGS